MATRYYIRLTDPANARGSDAELAFKSGGAEGFASELEDALRTSVLFDRWKAKQEEPDEVDQSLAAVDLNSTVTATMAGQIVMEGFLNIRLPAWLRRLVTRVLAIIPAVLVTWMYGESQSSKLLILSQVVLSLQLPFAIIPLVHLTATRKYMGALVAPRWLTAIAGVIAVTIVGLNAKLLYDLL